MRVAVLGAGVIGTSTAYQLAASGDDVVLIDQAESVGSGATSGNAGLVTAGDSNVWASPSTLRTIPAVLAGKSQSMRVDRQAGLGIIGWGARFLRECSTARNQRNVRACHALSTFSLKALRALTDNEGLDFGLQSNGLLALFDDRTELDSGVEARALLAQAGETYEVLDQEQLLELEPAFVRAPTPPQWAIHSPNDMSGDSLLFTQQLLDRCATLGVETRFDTTIEGFTNGPTGITGIETSAGTITADRYVVCLAHASPAIARTAGDRLTMMASTGFSMTAPIIDHDAVPQIPAIDEGRHVAFSRMGDALRLTSSAVMGSTSMNISDRDLEPMQSAVDALFPGAVDIANARRLARARPVMARNRPAIGRGRDPRVFYNTGHGALGWTQACGSAQLLTSILHQNTPPIDPTEYAIRT